MEYDFSNLQVHSRQIRLLKSLQRNGAKNAADLDMSDLFEDQLVRPTARCHEQEGLKEIEISDKGELYLKWRSEDRFRHRWPVYLSIGAFIISVLSLAISLFR